MAKIGNLSLNSNIFGVADETEFKPVTSGAATVSHGSTIELKGRRISPTCSTKKALDMLIGSNVEACKVPILKPGAGLIFKDRDFELQVVPKGYVITEVNCNRRYTYVTLKPGVLS